jgi:hypothetical protein
MFYTYVWLGENGTPYYVGKGKGDRAYSKHGRLHVPSLGRIVFYIAKDEEEAFENEIALIWYYGRKDLGLGPLVNLTNGGENPPRSTLGKSFSEKHNKAVSDTLKRKGIKPPSRKNVPHTEDTKQRIKNTMLEIRSKRTIRMAECHPDRIHSARGMCRPCYKRYMRKTAKLQQ